MAASAAESPLSWEQIGSTIQKIWQYEVLDMTGGHLTTGKILLGVLGILLSLLIAGIVSRWASGTATRRFLMPANQRLLLEKIVYFPAVALLVLTVLYWLSIPLTVFAFLGGALAIGLGFGAQTLINNFISGLILLLERQIKVGDIIEVGGSTGTVTHLGSRCSRIRKFDGVEVLVPNSSFLEKEVVNWTLNDPLHRYDFSIGVAYGSPVDQVMTILMNAVARQPEVLPDPAPGVFFEAFGDSSLVFRIYYWLEIGGSVDSRKVGSNIRTAIDQDLRAAGVEIPFPQRDWNLKTPGSPISVRIEESRK